MAAHFFFFFSFFDGVFAADRDLMPSTSKLRLRFTFTPTATFFYHKHPDEIVGSVTIFVPYKARQRFFLFTSQRVQRGRVHQYSCDVELNVTS